MLFRAAAFCLVLAAIAAEAACTSEGASRQKGTVPPPDVAAPPADAITTPSGLAYRVLVRGAGGARVQNGSRVAMNYTGWTTDGTIVEGAPIGDDTVTVEVDTMMPGLREGLRMMAAGDKYRFWIPPRLTFARADGKPQEMLVYDVYLVSIGR